MYHLARRLRAFLAFYLRVHPDIGHLLLVDRREGYGRHAVHRLRLSRRPFLEGVVCSVVGVFCRMGGRVIGVRHGLYRFVLPFLQGVDPNVGGLLLVGGGNGHLEPGFAFRAALNGNLHRLAHHPFLEGRFPFVDGVGGILLLRRRVVAREGRTHRFVVWIFLPCGVLQRVDPDVGDFTLVLEHRRDGDVPSGFVHRNRPLVEGFMHGLLTVRRIPVNVCRRFRVVLLRHRGALGHAGHRVWNLRAGLAVDPLDRHGFRGFRRRDRRSVLVEDKALSRSPSVQPRNLLPPSRSGSISGRVSVPPGVRAAAASSNAFPSAS